MGSRRRVVIMGAAGRDFHNFNVLFRDNASYDVVAFTAAQIPGIAGRRYPPVLAGQLYPAGIPILDEHQLEAIHQAQPFDLVVFAYSDVSHEDVMHAASRVLALGADFELLGPRRTYLHSSLPVVSVTAARTGSGKSPLSRWIARRLTAEGRRVAVIRHPMPYGNLETQNVQRFATLSDLDTANCTVEEREEYEGHITDGSTVYAGVDYGAILQLAQQQADFIVWDGGNNDFGFIEPDTSIAVLDALRADQASHFHPGESVLRMADIIVVNKVDSASPEQLDTALRELKNLNPTAEVVFGAMPIRVDDPSLVAGKRVIVVEDGPTITHGGMASGAGLLGAKSAGAAEVIDPRTVSDPELQDVFLGYPHIGTVIPALGYDSAQLESLRRWIALSGAEAVVCGSPIDLGRLVELTCPVARVRYTFEERGEPRLWASIRGALGQRKARS